MLFCACMQPFPFHAQRTNEEIKNYRWYALRMQASVKSLTDENEMKHMVVAMAAESTLTASRVGSRCTW